MQRRETLGAEKHRPPERETVRPAPSPWRLTVLSANVLQFHNYLDRSVSSNDEDKVVGIGGVHRLVIGIWRDEYKVTCGDRLFPLQALARQERSATADHVDR